jgi:hypothetical protein
MPVEAPTALSSPLKHYEVVIAPDPNRYESEELLANYRTDRIFPTPEPQRTEISPHLPKNAPIERGGFYYTKQ